MLSNNYSLSLADLALSSPDLDATTVSDNVANDQVGVCIPKFPPGLSKVEVRGSHEASTQVALAHTGPALDIEYPEHQQELGVWVTERLIALFSTLLLLPH